jgi:hypothetical protein
MSPEVGAWRRFHLALWVAVICSLLATAWLIVVHDARGLPWILFCYVATATWRTARWHYAQDTWDTKVAELGPRRSARWTEDDL